MIKHIILDTDIGGDPDDIFALLFALKSPEIKVDLVVTDDEHKGDRVRFAEKFFSLLERRAPIVSGIDLGNERLFVVGDLIKNFRVKVEKDFLEQMKEVIKKNKITYYVCIGPQSNLAKFIKKYPSLKNKVKILCMGGAINYRIPNSPEHNVKYDIKSAINVFNSDWDKKYVLSDVTFREEIKVDKKTKFFKEFSKLNKPHTNLIVESIRCFLGKVAPATMMHDPLTLSSLIDDKIINFEEKKVKINNKGVMSFSEKGKSTIISKSANYDLFWKLFRERILN